MCFFSSAKSSGGASTAAVVEQLNKQNNTLLSSEKVARTMNDKTTQKRTVSSLRVPMKNKTTSGTTGVNTTDTTTTGLNIPV